MDKEGGGEEKGKRGEASTGGNGSIRTKGVRFGELMESGQSGRWWTERASEGMKAGE